MFARIALDTSEYDSGVKDVTKSGSSLASKLKSGLASAGKAAAVGIGAITTAAGAAVGGLLALEQSTEEYRVAQGKLNTAFEAAGYSTESAKQAYTDFYKILGDTDTATEASQLLAKLSENEQDMTTWTRAAAGVWGTFGDSLPIEGLIESANETAKVGQVTGSLADALNWAGISEDEFNAKLASCSSESERNQIIMDTLSQTYEGAASAFYKNNETLVASRNIQAQLMDVMSELATTVQTVKTGLTSDFLPSVVSVVRALNGMLSGTAGASEQFALAVEELVAVAVEKLPEFLDFGAQIIVALVNGIVASIPSLVAAAPQVIASIASALIELLPQILDVGVQLLDQFTTGIETELPNMVARLPQVIEAILNFVSENLPAILEKGVELLSQFAFGIIDSIPVLVGDLPQIIQAITEFFVENFPKIVAAGGQLLGQLLVGILGAIPQIAVQLPSVVSAIVSALRSGWSQLQQAGRYLLEGLWSGISDKISWLKSKVSGVVNTIKSWFTGSDGFDTHSPSKWSANVMQNVMDGLSVGTYEGLPGALATVKNATARIKDGMDFGTATVDVDSSASGRIRASLAAVTSATEQAITIVVQSVLDGKVIGETAYQYSKNKQRAYGVT